MGTIPKLSAGQRLTGISAEGWNRFRAATLAVENSGGNPQGGLGAARSPSLFVRVLRDTAGSDLAAGSVVGLTKPAAELPSDTADTPEFPLTIDAKAPAAGESFAILETTLSAAADSGALAVYQGFAFAIVDIVSTDHKTAGAIDNDYAKLKSGRAGARIVARAKDGVGGDETGQQWCIVEVGGRDASASVAGNVAMLVADVNKFSAVDGAAITATPGKLADGAKLLDWKRDGGGEYEIPLVEFEAAQEPDPTWVDPDPEAEPPNEQPDIDKVRDAVNLSGTDIRASTGEPVLVTGYLQFVESDNGEGEVFIITNVMDFAALPGFVKGSAPGGADDDDLQIPFHSGGDRDFTLDSEDCGA